METDPESRIASDADGLVDKTEVSDWPLDLYRLLKAESVGQVSYVPDAGHARLIELFLRRSGDRHKCADDRGRGRGASPPAPGWAASAACS